MKMRCNSSLFNLASVIVSFLLLCCCCQAQELVQQIRKNEEICSTTGSNTASTPSDQLGPFYVENSKQTTLLGPIDEVNDNMKRLEVYGTVYSSQTCYAIPNVLIEVWYAGGDDNSYQNNEYRGKFTTDNNGEYNFVQVFPSLYPARPILHDHFRLSIINNNNADELLLVTQMYFEGDDVGFVSSSNTQRTLQTVQLVNDNDNGGRKAKFDIYVDYYYENDNNDNVTVVQPTPSPVLESVTEVPTPSPVEKSETDVGCFFSLGSFCLIICFSLFQWFGLC